MRFTREPDGLVIELSPAGLRDAPGPAYVVVALHVVAILLGVAAVLWQLRQMRLPLSAWKAVVFGTEAGHFAVTIFILVTAVVPVYALLGVLAWKGRTTEGPAVFHLLNDGRIAKRHGSHVRWVAHRPNVVSVCRRWGRLSLRMRPGHSLRITTRGFATRKGVDWLEQTFRGYLAGTA